MNEDVLSTDFLRRRLADLEAGNFPELPTLGGGGTSGGMEARVAVLEAHVEALRRDVGELRTDMRDVRDRLARIEVDIRHLPGKGYVTSVALAIMAFVAAIAAFQQQIQHFVHG